MAAQDTRLSEPVHRTACRVLYGDTDAGGVVYYANYLRYFEQGRTEFMRDLLVSYRTLEERGFIMPVVECYSRYKASARYDDLLVIESSLAQVKPVSCRFHYRIRREADQALLVSGFTVHVAVNSSGKLVKFPADFLEGLQKVCAHPVT